MDLIGFGQDAALTRAAIALCSYSIAEHSGQFNGNLRVTSGKRVDTVAAKRNARGWNRTIER